MWFPLFITIAGLCFGIFGARVLLDAHCVERLRRSTWHTPGDWPEGQSCDRYVRGTGYLVLGLALTLIGLLELADTLDAAGMFLRLLT